MGDLIQACGRLSDDLFPMPTEAALVGARDRTERVRLMALALFTWWDQMGSGWEHLQVDRRTLPDVDAWLRDVDLRHRALVASALEVGVEEASVAIGAALTSFGSWQSLRAAGMDVARAAAHVARFLSAPDSATQSKGNMH
jgi:hypothetical protein